MSESSDGSGSGNDASPANSRRRGGLLYRVIRRVLAYIVVLLAGCLVLRWTNLLESRVFYHPTREQFATPSGYEDVQIPTPDGLTLHGWFIPPVGAAKGSGPWPTILHCHGNAGNVDSHIDFSAFLADRGMAVLIFDYRGYGRSSAASGLTRDSLMTDTRAAYEYVLTRPDVDKGRIGVYGVSLGGVFALKLAADHPEIKGICTVAAFSSWSGVASDHVPLLGKLLISSGLDPIDSARGLGSRQYLIVHGDRDEIVNVRHAGLLQEAAKSSGAWAGTFIVPGGDHNGIVSTEHEQQQIADFFRGAMHLAD